MSNDTKNGKANQAPAAKEEVKKTETAVLDKPATETPPAKTYTQAEVEAIAAEIMAKHRPVTIRGGEVQESTAPTRTLDIPVTGRLEDVKRSDLASEGGEVLFEKAGSDSKIAELAFMEEVIDVVVAESTDPNDQPVIPLFVNGRSMYVMRGEVTPMKRHFADLLGRAKKETVKVTPQRTGNGDVTNHTTKAKALAYPFTVVRDPNPLGRAWLSKLMREGR